jgi:hypothetical protein
MLGTVSQKLCGRVSLVHWFHLCLIVGGLMHNKGCSSGIVGWQPWNIGCIKNNSKVAMEPLFDLNPLNHIWGTIHGSRVFIHSFL